MTVRDWACRRAPAALAAAGLVAAGLAATAVPATAAPTTAIQPAITVPSVFGWGLNNHGEVGTPAASDPQTTPLPLVSLPAGVRQVSGSAAVLADGTVYAWGDNTYGIFGSGSPASSNVPVQVPGLTGITQIANEYFFGLALGSDGTVWSWGSARFAPGRGPSDPCCPTAPGHVPGLTGITQIAASFNQGYALRSDGTVLAWGDNHFGQLGNGTTSGGQATPAPIPGLTGIIQIAATFRSGYALRSDGTVLAWGGNGVGQLGNGTVGGASGVPTRVPGLTGVTQIAAEDHVLAISGPGAVGEVWAWGDNQYGQLGDGTTTTRPSPVETGLYGVTQISASNSASAAVTSTGSLWTWGDNSRGGLGTGGGSSTSPVRVTNLTGVSQVSLGGDYGFAIAQSGKVPVPDVAGQDIAGATSSLFAVGLDRGTIRSVIDCNMLGLVKGQNPPAGTIAPTSTAISLDVGAQNRSHPCE
ncbi:MAG: PASTA domain-containing protein [Actinomycetota bacterium]